MNEEIKDPFEGAEVVSEYTDKQALEDGVLVALSTQNRTTCAVYGWLTKVTTKWEHKPPSNWPVEMLSFFGSKTPEYRAVIMARSLLVYHDKAARRVYDENIGGGIWKAVYHDTGHRLAVHAENDAPAGGTVLWILPNEIGGLTLMFPDDY